MLPTIILKKIEEKYGKPVTDSSICQWVASDIEKVSGIKVSETSVQRWFGFTQDHDRKLHTSTLNIIANYLGYETYDRLVNDTGSGSLFSDFDENTVIDCTRLAAGTLLQVKYKAGRVLLLRHMGNCNFIVEESVNSKLRKDDMVRIVELATGSFLNIMDVTRDGVRIGNYTAAKDGGIMSILEIAPD